MPPCTACGQDNPDIARFCLTCGAAMDVPASASHEEREVVSVLFCDLVGFTSRSESMDVEDVHGTLHPLAEPRELLSLALVGTLRSWTGITKPYEDS